MRGAVSPAVSRLTFTSGRRSRRNSAATKPHTARTASCGAAQSAGVTVSRRAVAAPASGVTKTATTSARKTRPPLPAFALGTSSTTTAIRGKAQARRAPTTRRPAASGAAAVTSESATRPSTAVHGTVT